MTNYTPKHLKKWTLPRDYFGEKWPEYFVFLGHHRDSDNLDNSNFDKGLEYIGGESESVIVVSENRWAVGWVGWIAIHESDNTALELADEVKERIGDYPILDEGDYSEREYTDFLNNCEQAVKDYCNHNDLEFNEDMVYKVSQASNECNADTWPDESEIESALNQTTEEV